MFLNTDKKGRYAEKLAQDFLTHNGYIIIKNRYKTLYGEIDIISVKDKTLAVIEVKYRKELSTAADSITLKQQMRIQNALLIFVSENPLIMNRYPFIRFDVILLCNSKSLIHIKNAWDFKE